MTLYQRYRRQMEDSGEARVFFNVENAGHHADAGEFPDRDRGAWRASPGDPVRPTGPWASGGFGSGFGAMRVLSIWTAFDLAARRAVSDVGSGPWRARWDRCAGRGDRPRSVGRARQTSAWPFGRPDGGDGGTGPALSEGPRRLFRRQRQPGRR